MKANYHSHTWRCNHAEGTEREMVERAIANGIQILGFSDHGEFLFDRDFKPSSGTDRLYREEILELKKEYEGRMPLFLGLEKDYYSDVDKERYDYMSAQINDLQKAKGELTDEEKADDVHYTLQWKR